MAKKLNLTIVREAYDKSKVDIVSSDISISVSGKSYRVNTQGSVTIELDSWSQLNYIIITDKISSANGKDYYKLAKNTIITRRNSQSNTVNYLFKLPVFDTALYVCFYTVVKDNAKDGDGNPTSISSGIDYQIDYKVDGKYKKEAGTTKPVKGLPSNTGYTHKMSLLINTSYTAYLMKDRKPITPTPILIGEKSSKALTFKVDKDLKFVSNKEIKNTFIKEYQLQTFLQFKIVYKGGDAIPKSTKVEVKLIDYAKKVKATLKVNPKTGLTEKISANYKRKIEVFIAGKKVNHIVKTIFDADGNVTPSAFNYLQTIEIPIIKAVTVIDKPKAEAMLAGKSKLPIVYDLKNRELLVLKPKDFKQFDEISAELGKLVQMSYQQRIRLATAYQQGKSVSEIQKIEAALGIAEDAVKDKLNSSYSTKSDLKEVFLVERYAGDDRGRGNTRLMRRYLENDAYLEYRNNRINQTDYSISLETGSGVGISASPESLDVAGLVDSIKNISLSVEKEWESEQYSKDLDLSFLSKSLISSANELSRSIQISEKLDVDTTAQWLRAVGGASANSSAEWSPKEGDIDLSAGFDVSGKLVLCEGNIETRMAIPSKEGWRLRAKFAATGEIDLGAIRFIISCDFFGFTGVKASIAGSASIKFEGGSQKLIAASRTPKQTAATMWDAANKQRKFEVERSYEPVEVMDANSNTKADIGITAFAGAEAGITPAGSIEWLNPEVKDFRSFAKVSGTIAGSAGAGFSGSFYVFYLGGKFKVRAQAALCFGLGGSGGMEFEIDSGLILEFVRWLSYQLLHAGFRTLVYIQGRAFERISELSVLVFGNNANITQALQNIETGFTRFLTYIDTDKARVELAQRIISKRDDDWLKYATPEAKGMLLYQLTRHAKVSHTADTPTTSIRSMLPIDIDIDLLNYRKQAIIIIFATVTTSSEWMNVLQHMTIRGNKGNLGKNEGDIIRLLNYGVGLADESSVLDILNSGSATKPDTGSSYVNAYITMRQKVELILIYPKGIEVVKNTDAKYDIYSGLGDYTSPDFYAAANPDQYDLSGFDNTSVSQDDNDSYLV